MNSMYRVGAAALGLTILATGGYLGGVSSRIVPPVRAEGRDDDRRPESCSLTRLKGSYGFTTTGSIVSAGPVGLVADVGVMTFDGLGGISETETLSLNGAIVERTSPGDYTVDPDCTGDITLVLPPPATGVATSHFVMVDEGKELRAIVTGPGRVLTTVARRQ